MQISNTREEIKRFIISFVKENGYCPSIRETATTFKLTKETIRYHYQNLVNQGVLERGLFTYPKEIIVEISRYYKVKSQAEQAIEEIK
jgi:DNA-binding transcriptional regulator YhcF (GntR family)